MEDKNIKMEDKKKRCSFEGCKKKLKLISFSCQCGGEFCQAHRYTSSHNCPCLQNKKNTCKEFIKDNNPVVSHSKLVKI